MLTTLRNHSQSWLIKVMLGMIVVTFIISFGIGTFSNPKEVMVRVGKTEIMVNEFLRRYQREMDRIQQQYGKDADQIARQMNLRQQVFDNMVNRELFLQDAAEKGILIDDREVRDAVQSQTTFFVNEKFDFPTYRSILLQNNLTPKSYEELIREDLTVSRQQKIIGSGIIISPLQVDQHYRTEKEKVEVDYFMFDPAKIKDVPAPGEEALKEYYDQNPKMFTQDEQFTLEYFILDSKHFEDTTSISERALRRHYERNLETEFTSPPQVKASHILKKLPKDLTEDQVAAKKKELEEILVKARAGEDFAGLAKKHSEDMSKDKGGDLGFFKREDMVPEFSTAAFSMQKGQISDIVRSQFGFHIIKVTDSREGSVKSFEEVKGPIEQILKSSRVDNLMERELKQLPNRIASEGLEAVATGLGKKVLKLGPFDGTKVDSALGSLRPLYSQIRRKNTGDGGAWQRNPIQGHVFYQVREKKESFVKPLEQVRGEVLSRLQMDERRKAALEEARKAFPGITGANEFTGYSKSKGLEVKTVAFTSADRNIEGVGFNSEFKKIAFTLSGEKPVGLSIKGMQAHVMLFKRRFYQDQDKAEQEKKEIRERLENELRRYVLEKEIARLKKNITVDILAPEYLSQGS
ncbi:MAG: SurA N-terminal domain-containing protein [Deltaproteobacteria bacterium]|nr:SurA N-terminal domain-containing protein [Deltaproteobacteria bacterium]